MKKLLTLEFDFEQELIELHLNRERAEYLKNILEKLILEKDNKDIHLMTPDWGGNELSNDPQNENENIKLIHHLKLIYWKK